MIVHNGIWCNSSISDVIIYNVLLAVGGGSGRCLRHLKTTTTKGPFDPTPILFLATTKRYDSYKQPPLLL